MKIALICTEKLPVPAVSGGAIQIYIDGILPVLSRHHEITVFSVQSSKLPITETVGNVRHVRIQGRTRHEYLNSLKRVISGEYRLIHVFNRPVWIPSLSQLAPDSAFSLSLHNEMFLPKKIDPEKAQNCIDRVSFITTVSRFIADGVKNLYPPAENKLNVVYSGVDIAQYKPLWSRAAIEERNAMRAKFGINDHKVILYVGRLSSKKGAHVLLQAMKRVTEKHPRTAVVFVGSKWYGTNATDDYVRQLQMAAEELKDVVIFTGFLPPREIPKYYNLGDIFTCVSQWREPLARVHYEAMAAGLPIITTNRGGNAEVINQGVNGLIVEEHDNPQVLADNIIYLMEHPDAALDMGREGKRLVEEKYNLDRTAHQLLELFKKI